MADYLEKLKQNVKENKVEAITNLGPESHKRICGLNWGKKRILSKDAHNPDSYNSFIRMNDQTFPAK